MRTPQSLSVYTSYRRYFWTIYYSHLIANIADHGYRLVGWHHVNYPIYDRNLVIASWHSSKAGVVFYSSTRIVPNTAYISSFILEIHDYTHTIETITETK